MITFVPLGVLAALGGFLWWLSKRALVPRVQVCTMLEWHSS
jgi:hypothetical protein